MTGWRERSLEYDQSARAHQDNQPSQSQPSYIVHLRMIPLLADASWPTPFDAVVTAIYLGTCTLLPAFGFVLMAIDLRKYLRSLRRTLVRVRQVMFERPEWARRQTPACVAALGLHLPCSEDDLKRAYRRRVKSLHPDHGGDRRRFLYLQRQFEEALEVIGAAD